MIGPLISIIIPMYNAEKYIKECVDSILSQSIKDIEIIIIDDGSMDQSLKIVNNFYGHLKNVIIIKLNKNSGSAIAKNKGLKYVSGKYVAFIDADDFVLQNYLKVLYDAAENNNVDVVCMGYRNIVLNKNGLWKEEKSINVVMKNIILDSNVKLRLKYMCEKINS